MRRRLLSFVEERSRAGSVLDACECLVVAVTGD
jgi:hypothetical protein